MGRVSEKQDVTSYFNIISRVYGWRQKSLKFDERLCNVIFKWVIVRDCTEFLQEDENCSSCSASALCCFSVVYLFDAQTGKPIGDGKPLTHKVNYAFILPSTDRMYIHTYALLTELTCLFSITYLHIREQNMDTLLPRYKYGVLLLGFFGGFFFLFLYFGNE